MNIKIECACGQRYAFDVEPVNGQLPSPVACPVCGADGTAAGNESIAQQQQGQPAPKAGLRIAAIPPGGATGPVAPPDQSLRGAFDTYASNPAMLPVSFTRLLATGDIELWTVVVILPVMFGIKVFTGRPWTMVWAALVGCAVVLWTILRARKAKFRAGDVCPGIVISDKPWMVAVLTNMAADEGRPRPVIKILRQPLGRMAGGAPQIGARVAAVAWYQGPPKGGAWRDFMPDVVNCGSDDLPGIERVLSSIRQAEWAELEAGLAQLPDKKEGLHWLQRGWMASGGAFQLPGAATAGEPVDDVPTPRRSLFSSPVVKALVIILGLVLLIIVCAFGLAMFKYGGSSSRRPPVTFPDNRHAPFSGGQTPAPQSYQAGRAAVPQAPTGIPNNTGYKAGDKIEAQWAGQWRPATVTGTRGNILVEFRFDQPPPSGPITMPANMIRPRAGN